MKATELRIGNLIKDDEGVFEVTASFFNLLKNNLKFCKPIPLTKVWLLKFGFVYNGWNYDFERFVFHSQWETASGEFYNTEFYIKRGNVQCLVSFQLKYVHQLQNLYFALTGEELKCKL